MKTKLSALQKRLQQLPVEVIEIDNQILINYKQDVLNLTFSYDALPSISKMVLPPDYLITNPDKIFYFIQSKLQLNKTVYARNCQLKKIDKTVTANFLNTYHLLNSANSAYNYGLFYRDELLCMACFSKGRKMNRLREHQRSFELIRFCTKGGITITGGLSKLLKHFCNEKNAGDIMTYIDKQISDGKSFLKAGFKLHSETDPTIFLINRKIVERIALKNKNEIFDETLFYRTENLGNLKLVYTP